MCGRITKHHSEEEVVERFEVASVQFADLPRYNVAPSQTIAAVAQQEERRLVGFKWGLVPFWAKDPAIGNRMINAKAETLSEKPSFKQALVRRRCLIPADGFYEWKSSKGGKDPYYFRRKDGALFAFAGLWEEWSSADDMPLRTCTIITVEPNEFMAPFHHRMPAILKREDEALWLDPKAISGPSLLKLLRPYPDDDFECYPVARAVNSPLQDDVSCIRPLSSPLS